MSQERPLQNRVHPSGELCAVPERGLMLGNRGGKFHRDDQTLGKRRWATHHWICCELNYKNLHHDAMGKGYTSLFFLDEVTALAAGHRPCFYCRRKEAQEFVKLSGMTTDELDRQLHWERASNSSSSRRKPGTNISPDVVRTIAEDLLGPGFCRGDGLVEIAELPSGAMIELDGEPFAIRNTHILRWTFSGYTEISTPPLRAKLLTPPAILRILRKGFKPRWHPSALQWETS